MEAHQGGGRLVSVGADTVTVLSILLMDVVCLTFL